MHYDMPCDPNLVSSAFYTIPIFPLKLLIFYLLVSCLFFAALSNNYTAVIRLNPNTLIPLQRLEIFRNERVNETIVVHYISQEQNLLFHCVFASSSSNLRTCTCAQLCPALWLGQN